MSRTLGQAIRDMRQSRGWSQQELAERAGLHESTVYRAELGLVRPKAESLEAVFTAFGPEALARWQEDPEFYKESVRGLAWGDETLPSWILWVEEKEELMSECICCGEGATIEDVFCQMCYDRLVDAYDVEQRKLGRQIIAERQAPHDDEHEGDFEDCQHPDCVEAQEIHEVMLEGKK